MNISKVKFAAVWSVTLFNDVVEQIPTLGIRCPLTHRTLLQMT